VADETPERPAPVVDNDEPAQGAALDEIPGDDIPRSVKYPTHDAFIASLTPRQFMRLGWMMQRAGIHTTYSVWETYFSPAEESRQADTPQTRKPQRLWKPGAWREKLRQQARARRPEQLGR
jgi:hypothetical protein